MVNLPHTGNIGTEATTFASEPGSVRSSNEYYPLGNVPGGILLL
jgi:hypothetical protein